MVRAADGRKHVIKFAKIGVEILERASTAEEIIVLICLKMPR